MSANKISILEYTKWKKERKIISTRLQVEVNISKKTQWKRCIVINTETYILHKLIFYSMDECLNLKFSFKLPLLTMVPKPEGSL